MSNQSSDFKIISQRILKHNVDIFSDSDNVRTYMQNLNDDGSWRDLDYTSNAIAMWESIIHLKRLWSMSTVYAGIETSKLYKSEELKNCIIRALSFWAKNDFVNQNWWYNEIGRQQPLRNVAINMGEELSEDLQDYIISTLQSNVDEKWTGANKMWIAENILCKGILTKGKEFVNYATKAIAETITIAKNSDEVEGIQPDFSFTQHGRQLYSFGYGGAFIAGITTWFCILKDTEMSFKKENVDLLTSLVLEGHRWMYRYSCIDFNTQGREITRHHNKNNLGMRGYIKTLEGLSSLQTDVSRREALQNMILHIEGSRNDPGIIGNKMFWCADYMTHLRQKYYASVRMLSKGVVGSEVINGENTLAGFAAYGITTFMVHACEYDKIFGLWNWALLPGVTCPMVELPTELGCLMDNEFVGGVTNGMYGAAAIDLYKEYCIDKNEGDVNFSAKKAYFFFDDEIVMLGSGVSSNAPQPMNTTLNQCHLRDDVYIDNVKIDKSSMPREATGKYVYHDGIGYVFMKNQKFMLKNGEQTGNWKRISTAHDVPDADIKGDMFTLYIDHGAKPTDEEYQYIVLPGITQDKVKHYSENIQIEILSNTKKLQAVRHKNIGIVSAIFYENGSIKVEDIILSVSQPCMLIYDKKDDGNAEISISNPQTVGLKIEVNIDNGKNSKTYTANLSENEIELGETFKINVCLPPKA